MEESNTTKMTHKTGMLCFVLFFLAFFSFFSFFNLVCVWILFYNAGSHTSFGLSSVINFLFGLLRFEIKVNPVFVDRPYLKNAGSFKNGPWNMALVSRFGLSVRLVIIRASARLRFGSTSLQKGRSLWTLSRDFVPHN